jgi:hypothetical protein
MDQVTNEPKRGGGDTRTPQAKQEIAKREEQIVALRLRHHSFAAIGRVVGISEQIKIPARTRLRFTPAKALKDSVLGVTATAAKTKPAAPKAVNKK